MDDDVAGDDDVMTDDDVAGDDDVTTDDDVAGDDESNWVDDVKGYDNVVVTMTSWRMRARTFHSTRQPCRGRRGNNVQNKLTLSLLVTENTSSNEKS